MNLPFINSDKDIIIVYKDTYLYTRASVEESASTSVVWKKFESLNEIYKHIKKPKKLIVLLSNQSSFDDELTVSPHLRDHSVLNEVLQSKYEEKSTSVNEVLFHHIENSTKSSAIESYYYLYGFEKKSFELLMHQIPEEVNLEIVSSLEYVVYNYFQKLYKGPFIAIQYFCEQEILIAGDGKHLIFSRTHTVNESSEETLLRALDYLTQSFPLLDFKLYIPLHSDKKELTSLLKSRFSVSPNWIKHEQENTILKALKTLPGIFNFTPKIRQINARLNQVQDIVLKFSIILFFFLSLFFFQTMASHKKTNSSYEIVEKAYKKELKNLNLMSETTLKQHLMVDRFHSHREMKLLGDLVFELQQRNINLDIHRFSFKKKNKYIRIGLSQTFSSLHHMDSFYIKWLDRLKNLKQRFPNISIKSYLDFKKLKINVDIQSIYKFRKHKKV